MLTLLVLQMTFEFILVGFLLGFEKITSARVGCWVKCSPERLELKVVGLYSAVQVMHSQNIKPHIWDAVVRLKNPKELKSCDDQSCNPEPLQAVLI